MKDGKLGFGLVGLGLISKTHYLALQNQPDCYLAGCFDVVPRKAQAWGADHGCKGYNRFEDMLADPEIDAISITTPSGYHLQPALQAIRAGKHVLIEKPMEIKEERIQQLIDEARAHDVVLSGIFQSRFHEVSGIIRKAVEEGRFGRISLCDAQIKWFRDQAYYDSGAWRGTWAVDGGGVMIQQSIHAIDLLLFLMGSDPEEITAYTSTVAHDIEVEDTATAIIKFGNGALGVIEGTTSAWPGSLKRIEICGSDGQAVLEEDSITKWNFRDERPEDEDIRRRFAESSSVGGATDAAAISYVGHAKEFADVALAIKNRTQPFVTGEEAKRSVHLIEALYRSAREGRSVKL